MPVIDLGVDFSDVQDMDIFEPLPNGTYKFHVAEIIDKPARSGRPMLKWTLTVNHEGKDYKLFYNTVLPWFHDGEMDLGGVGMLVGITKALGKPWTGQALNTDDYLSKTGTCVVVQKPKQIQQMDGTYANDPGGAVVNDIKNFVY